MHFLFMYPSYNLVRGLSFIEADSSSLTFFLYKYTYKTEKIHDSEFHTFNARMS